MDPNHFDTISKLFASRRTRRAAVGGGLGLATAAIGDRALAQNATPVPLPNDPHPNAEDAAPKTFYLFVQPFDGGTWAPKEGDEGVFTLTLTGAAANTVYFSDRPERIVGITPNQTFLDGLGFTPDNLPNAAIVATRDGGDEQEVLVIELLNPAYDADTQTLTYDARVLADYGEHGLAHLAAQQQDYELGETFGAGGLFIDDCSAQSVDCVSKLDGTNYGTIMAGFCWNEAGATCNPCQPQADAACKDAFPDCVQGLQAGDRTVWVNVCEAG